MYLVADMSVGDTILSQPVIDCGEEATIAETLSAEEVEDLFRFYLRIASCYLSFK